MSQVRISVLADNIVQKQPFGAEHGFSVLIENDQRVVLFDVGGSDLFYRNSRGLNIELFGVDDIVISHGHYDHTGGLAVAMREAPHAVLHLHERALDKKMSASTGTLRYIGLPESARNAVAKAEDQGQLSFIKDNKFSLAENMTLFSSGGRKSIPDHWPFFIDNGGSHADPDRFKDEISLLIHGRDCNCLVVGCAHCGLDDIYTEARKLSSKPVRYVIGGSHLDSVPDAEIARVAAFFAEEEVQLILGHCTGINGYSRLYSHLFNQLTPIYAGLQFALDL